MATQDEMAVAPEWTAHISDARDKFYLETKNSSITQWDLWKAAAEAGRTFELERAKALVEAIETIVILYDKVKDNEGLELLLAPFAEIAENTLKAYGGQRE